MQATKGPPYKRQVLWRAPSNPLDSSFGDWRNTPLLTCYGKGVCFIDLLNDKGRNTDPKWLLEEQQVDVPDPNPSSASDHPRYQPSIVRSIWSVLSFGPAGVILLPLLQCMHLRSKGRGPWMSPHCCLKKAWCGENVATLMLFSLSYRVALQKHYWHCCYVKHFKDVFHTEAELSNNYNLAAGFCLWFLLSCRTSCYCAA